MKKITQLLILILPFISCSQQENKTEENQLQGKQSAAKEQRMMEFYQKVMNAHNPSLVDSFCTTDFVEHQPFPGYGSDVSGLKKGLTDWFAGFPDVTITVDMIKSWGDTVMTKFRVSGTNSGPYMGMPATNKTFNVEGVDIIVLNGDKAKEHWGYVEESKMMNQLGMGQPTAEESPDKKHD